MRKVLSGVFAAAMAVALLVQAPSAQADPWTKINAKQCKEAHAAVAAGKPLPQPELFAKEGTSMKGNVLELYVTSQFRDDVKVAVNNWLAVTDGKVEIRMVDTPTKNSVKVEDSTYNIGAFGYNYENPPRIVLNSVLMPGMTPKNRQYIIAHEMGHAMGLGHTCPGDIMLRGGSGQVPSLVPTRTDGAAVVQNLR